ncbi:MAG: hypothetical protein ACOX5Z_06330 [Desulfobulbus sp.]|jgi:hypothetical protein
MNVGALFDSILAKCGALAGKIGALLDSTGLPEQIQQVDAAGLFSNPWFLIPFIGLVGYMLYKKAIHDLLIMAILGMVWYATGTDYMQTLVIGDELQLNKVLPVILGGVGALAAIVFLLMGRSE